MSPPGRPLPLPLLPGALLLSAASCSEPGTTLELEVGVRDDGTATESWTEGIAVALGRTRAEELAAETRPLSPEATAWLEVLEEALPHVAERAPELAALFDLGPFDALIAAGNRGSSDAFGWVPRGIGVNLQAFHASYGAPDAGAVDRMTRIVAHEYLHLVTYEAYPHHRELRDTPYRRALWTIFFEGIGDYVSMSERWLPAEDGSPSPAAADALAVLEPVFLERLEALADCTPEEEDELRRGISMGRFDQKWGSLPFALWLRSEVVQAVRDGATEREVLRRVAREGPASVLPLARAHVADEHRRRMEALLAARPGPGS